MMTPIEKYIEASKDKASAATTMSDCEQEFIESLFDGTPEQAQAVYDILNKRTFDSFYRNMGRMQQNEEASKKSFFGRAYDKLFGGSK